MSIQPLLIAPDAPLDWQPLGPGTRWARLGKRADRGTVYRIQGEPGGVFPAHRHAGGEEVYVLSGDYADDSGSYGAGSYLSYPAGSTHQPWTVGGCDLFVIWWSV